MNIWEIEQMKHRRHPERQKQWLALMIYEDPTGLVSDDRDVFGVVVWNEEADTWDMAYSNRTLKELNLTVLLLADPDRLVAE